MKCFILAAGYATRLYPLTENFPKPLLKVADKAILEWLIEDLASKNEINEYVVISNHKFSTIFEDWANTMPYPITVLDDGTSSNETRLGAVKDIKFAWDKLEEKEDIFVMAGDNLLDFSLNGFIDFAKEKNTSSVMSHIENELKKQQKTAIITIDENNKITSYEEKPKQPKGNLAVPPFYFYKKEDIAKLDEALEDGCNADAPGSFAAWLSSKKEMHAYIMPGKRYDIGDVASYNAVKETFENM